MQHDITVVMTVHAEGRILHHTFTALHRAITYAQRKPLSVEIVAVLDRVTDPVIADVLKSWKSVLGDNLATYEADFGALSPSRNFGISRAKGEFISILDGDDLYGRNWLLEAHEVCSGDPNKIAHPWFVYYFPIDPYLICYNEKKSACLDLLLYNQWSALSLAHRDIFGDIPYVRDDETYAFQDWLWNCHTSASGHEHVLIPETLMAVRQSAPGRSLWQSSYHLNKVVRPNIHHRKILQRAYPEFLVPKDGEGKKTGFLDPVLNRAGRGVKRSMDRLHRVSPPIHGFVINSKRSLVHGIRTALNPDTVPGWVRAEISEISRIEPTLKKPRNIQTRKPIGKVDIPRLITPAMAALVSADKPSVYIIDRADMGQVHQAALGYMQIAGRPSFLLSTEAVEGDYDAHMPEGSRHIPIGKANLIYEERLKLTHRLLLECDPQFIHVFDSQMAMEILDRYANTLSGKKLLGTFLLYNEDEGADANAVGFPLNRYPHLLDYFSGISTNTACYKRILMDIFGLEDHFIHLHRTPFSARLSESLFGFAPGDPSQGRIPDSPDRLKILWLKSGDDRFSTGQIIRIASALHRGFTDISFEIVHTSGRSLLQRTPLWSGKVKIRDLSLRNTERIRPILLSRRTFLVVPHLSSRELSFVVHAMGGGVPLIAGKGLLAEEFCSEETGWLLEGDNVARGLQRIIQENLDKGDLYRKKSQASRSFIDTYHSWEGFRQSAQIYYGHGKP